MPIIQQHLPTKAFYLDRLGNMSTSSSSVSSVSSINSNAQMMNGRKQILTLKPKQTNSYVHHLEHKSKDGTTTTTTNSTCAPVTMLALKKKEKTEKNVVTTLIYRKPSSLVSGSTSSSSTSSDHHLTQLMMATRRPGSPSSSGYETDSMMDQENCDVFSSLLNTSFVYDHHDMLHSHPIWSPQTSSDGLLMKSYFMENEKSNKFLVQ